VTMRFFLSLLLVLTGFLGMAQSPLFHIDGTAKNRVSGKPEAGVRVELIQSGNVVLQSTSTTAGKYEIKGVVDFKKPFEVRFTKSGFVSKKLSFDYSKMNIEDAPPGDIRPFKSAEFEMIPTDPNMDLSFLEAEPVGKFYWDERKLTGDFDKVHSERIKLKIEKVITDSQKNNAANDAQYQALIKEADALYTAQKWEEALAKYEAALLIKPMEKHPNDRVRELDELIMAKKKEDLANQQADSEYLNLIKAADALRDQKKYEQAILKYEEALRKKDEDYPRTQIAEIKALTEKDAKYKEAVTQADMFYNQKSYQAAKDKYTIANKLKPEEQHPINRLAEIEKKQGELNAAQEKKKKYDDAIAAGDELFSQEKYEDARAKYQEALTFESASSYATGRIDECNKKISEALAEKQRLEKIQKLLEEGNTLFTASKWNDSRAKYNEVITLDSSNKTAIDRLAEIEQKIKEEGDLAAREAKFVKLVGEGDVAVKGTKYADAKSKYEEALTIKDDAAVKTKLDDVLKKIKDLEDKDAADKKFQELKAEGFKLAGEEKWIDAKTALKAALDIKADPQVTQKLADVEAKIKANEALVKLEQEYQDLITSAQQKETAKDLDGAIAKYKEASLKKPTEQMPKDKVRELEDLKKSMAKDAELNAQYNSLMTTGKELMAQQKYLDAIKQFNQANGLKPEEKEPVDLAAECERLEKEKGNEEDHQFEKMLSVAQTKLDEKDYVKARELADRAAKFRPADSRPKELIDKINKIEAAEKGYTLKMQEGEKFASDKNYAKAITSFEAAKQFKPEETLPQERIDEMNRLIAEQASSADKEKLYSDFMTKGGLSFTAKNWEQALVHYQSALNVKPGDRAAQDKVDEIQQIIDDLANASKTEQENQDKFNKLVKEADQYFTDKDYMSARGKYESALDIYSTNVYAKKQVEECIRLERLRSGEEEERGYRKIIEKADSEFTEKLYESALEYYNRALTMRPADPYPKQKIDEINAILNPPVVGSVNLKPLGEPYPENSIMDGYAALVKADIERKNIKDQKVEERVYVATEREAALSDAAVNKQKETTNEIYRIVGTISDEYEDSDENREAIVQALRNADNEYELIAADDQEFKQADLRKAQGQLDYSVQEGAIDYTQRESVYKDNTALLHSYEDVLRIEMTDRTNKDELSNVTSDQQLRVVESKIISLTDEGYDRQKRNDELVDNIIVSSETDTRSRNTVKELELLKGNDLIVQENIMVDVRAENDAKFAPENKTKLENVEVVVSEAEKLRSEANAAKITDNSGKFIVLNKELEEDNTDREINRKENAELVKQNEIALNEGKREEFERENLKYLRNKNVIETEDQKQIFVSEKGAEQVAGNIEGVEQLNTKANIAHEAGVMSDDQQRQGVRSGVETINANVEDYSSGSTKKQEKNAVAVEDLNKAAAANASNRENEKKDKILDAQKNLDNISTERPEKIRIKNALGQDYPEGVSQESFTQNDENGLMKAIITRRIVVINGQGNVYVRTQTLHNITYTKNDVPTTEHVWNKETMGPHLEKHY
jgi:epidermal growth factor receptor substrate 15